MSEIVINPTIPHSLFSNLTVVDRHKTGLFSNITTIDRHKTGLFSNITGIDPHKTDLLNSIGHLETANELLNTLEHRETGLSTIHDKCGPRPTTWSSIGLIVLSIPIIVVNVLVLASVYLVNPLHNPQDVMVALVSVADLMVGLIYIPTIIFSMFYADLFSPQKEVCSLLYLNTSVLYFSLTCYLLMCMNCYFAINFPFMCAKYQTISRTIYMVAVTAVVTVLHRLSLVMLLIEFDVTLPPGEQCSLERNLPMWYDKVYHEVLNFLKLVVSLALSVQFHLVAKRQRTKSEERRRRFSELRKKPSASILQLLCSVLFIILWFPSLVTYTIGEYRLLGNSYVCALEVITCYLRCSNCFLNPLLLGYFKPLYRNCFKTILSTPPWKVCELKTRLRAVSFVHFHTTSRPGGTTLSTRTTLSSVNRSSATSREWSDDQSFTSTDAGETAPGAKESNDLLLGVEIEPPQTTHESPPTPPTQAFTAAQSTAVRRPTISISTPVGSNLNVFKSCYELNQAPHVGSVHSYGSNTSNKSTASENSQKFRPRISPSTSPKPGQKSKTGQGSKVNAQPSNILAVGKVNVKSSKVNAQPSKVNAQPSKLKAQPSKVLDSKKRKVSFDAH